MIRSFDLGINGENMLVGIWDAGPLYNEPQRNLTIGVQTLDEKWKSWISHATRVTGILVAFWTGQEIQGVLKGKSCFQRLEKR